MPHATTKNWLVAKYQNHRVDNEILWDTNPKFDGEWTRGLAQLLKDGEKAGVTYCKDW